MPSKRGSSSPPLLPPLLLFLAVSSTVASHPLEPGSDRRATVQAPAVPNTDPEAAAPARYVRLDDVTEPLDEVGEAIVVVPAYLQGGAEVPLYEHRVVDTEAAGGWGLKAVVAARVEEWRERLGRIWAVKMGGGEGNVNGGKEEDL